MRRRLGLPGVVKGFFLRPGLDHKDEKNIKEPDVAEDSREMAEVNDIGQLRVLEYLQGLRAAETPRAMKEAESVVAPSDMMLPNRMDDGPNSAARARLSAALALAGWEQEPSKDPQRVSLR